MPEDRRTIRWRSVERIGAVLAAGAVLLWWFETSHELLSGTVAVSALAVAIAVMVNSMVRRQRRTARQLEDLLVATHGFIASDELTTTANVLETGVLSVVTADLVATFLVRSTAPTTYVNVNPLPAPLPAELEIDATNPTRSALLDQLLEGNDVFIPDVLREPHPRPILEALSLRSALIVPLADGTEELGALLIGWRRPQRRLDAATRRAVEILTTAAASMLRRQRIEERTARRATTDALTGIANRHQIEHRLDLARPGDAIAIVDLDHFKQVNDDHGHAAGDETIRSLANSLTSVCRNGADWCGRLGGEEFILVVAGAGSVGAGAVLRRLRASWDDADELTTFSVGVAILERGELPRHALARADDALYQAKRRGRRCSVFATRERSASPA